jgi:hypothetical protein
VAVPRVRKPDFGLEDVVEPKSTQAFVNRLTVPHIDWRRI